MAMVAAAAADGGEGLPRAASLPSIDELVVGIRLVAPPPSAPASPSRGEGGRAGWVRAGGPGAGAGGGRLRRGRGHRRSATDLGRYGPGSVTTTITTTSTAAASSSSSSAASSNGSFRREGPSAAAAQLLRNMTGSHLDRNPYDDYLVLGEIGKGSIGSVDKVVRRHRRGGTSRGGSIGGNGEGRMAREKRGGGVWCWNLFGPCCGGQEDDESQRGNDAFRPTTNSAKTATAKDDSSDRSGRKSSRSVVSESSAFSAPTSPVLSFPRTTQRASLEGGGEGGGELRASSLHGIDLSLPSRRHREGSGGQHPLRRYALKSIRLERTQKKKKGWTGKQKEGSPGGGGISSADEAELRNEISILRSLDHPNIVHVIETYVYEERIYMVLDLCENGDLYVLDPYSENEARAIVRQLLQAVSYMHHRGIVHRDLKYENVMFADRGGDRSRLEIKLIDFGLSIKYGASRRMTDFVGTIYTMAPEVIRGSYTCTCDVWSLGVMAYMLLSSQIPFSGKDAKEIAQSILFSLHSFSGRKWSKISKRGRDFVSSLLIRDPLSRPSADSALKHPWLAGGRNPSINARPLHHRNSSEAIGGTAIPSLRLPARTPLDSQICSSIEHYSSYSWMHRLALMVVAYRRTGQETAHLRQVYLSYDVDDSGTVEVEELGNAFALHGKYSNEEIDHIFLAVDMSGSGKISWTEFLAATIETTGGISDEELSSAFEHLDFDKNGYISTVITLSTESSNSGQSTHQFTS